jgi:hypothetical protein
VVDTVPPATECVAAQNEEGVAVQNEDGVVVSCSQSKTMPR